MSSYRTPACFMRIICCSVRLGPYLRASRRLPGSDAVDLRLDNLARIGMNESGLLERAEEIGGDALHFEFDDLIRRVGAKTECQNLRHVPRIDPLHFEIDEFGAPAACPFR